MRSGWLAGAPKVRRLAGSGNIIAMSQAERERILTVARETLIAVFPDAWAIYAFGSFARGEGAAA